MSYSIPVSLHIQNIFARHSQGPLLNFSIPLWPIKIAEHRRNKSQWNNLCSAKQVCVNATWACAECPRIRGVKIPSQYVGCYDHGPIQLSKIDRFSLDSRKSRNLTVETACQNSKKVYRWDRGIEFFFERMDFVRKISEHINKFNL